MYGLESSQLVFEKLKQVMTFLQVLAIPDFFSVLFIVKIDASKTAIGAVLLQNSTFF